MSRSAADAARPARRLPGPIGLLVAGLLVAVLVLLAVGMLPARAQTDELDVRLTVTSLTTAVGPGTRPADAEAAADADDLRVRVLVQNDGPEEVEDLFVFVEVFGRVETRSELHRGLDGGGRPARLLESRIEEVADGDELAPGAIAPVQITAGAASIGWGDLTGVHPVKISVLSGSEPVDSVTTGVVSLASAPEQPLPTMIGWPVDAAPRSAIADRFEPDAVRDILQGGRLERLVWALEQHPDLPVQLLSSAHVVQDLAAMSDGFTIEQDGDVVPVPDDDPRAVAAAGLLDRLRTAVAARAAAVVASPYADADLATLHGAGFTLEAVREVIEGRSRLEGDLGERPVPDALWATTPLDTATLREVLGPAGVDRVVLGWEQLVGGQERPARTPPPLHTLRSGGVEASAVVADPWLQDLLADLPSEHGVTIAVQRLLAETAQAHLEQPGASEGRGIVLLPPAGWDPSPRTAEGLLAGLSRAPWVRPMALGDLGAAFGEAPPRAQLDLASVSMPPGLRGALQQTHERLAALQAAVTDQVDQVGGHGWGAIESALQRVPSGWWLPDDTRRAETLLTSIGAALDAGFGTVRLPPDAHVTLTDTEGRVPVTVSRPEGPPIQVVVELDAPKLDLPDDARLVTLTEGSQQTISFAAVAQASGRIPVTVRVKTPGAIDPDGAPWVELASETMVVRSTIFSGTAITILGGILLLLLGWWGYRRWRPPSPQLAVVRDEAA